MGADSKKAVRRSQAIQGGNMQTQITGLYGLFLERLAQAKTSCKKEIIPFPVVFEKLCLNFSITKPKCWEVLFLLRDTGFIQIVAGHGVKLKFNI